MDKINTEQLKKLGTSWKILNEKYDSTIVALIDAAELALISSEKLEQMNKMQDEIFNLEKELFRILQGK